MIPPSLIVALFVGACATLAVLPAPALARTLPLTAVQRSNLGIVVASVKTRSAVAITASARVVLPPTAIAVIAAGGAGLVTRLHVQAGDTVKRGAPIAALAMPGLAEAQSMSTQARLRANLANTNAERDGKLFAEGLIAESRRAASQSEAASARAALTAAQAQAGLLGHGTVRGAELTLTSPFAGSVLDVAVEPGARVDAGMALAKIADLSKLALEISLSPSQAAGVAIGQAVMLDDGTQGRVTAVLPQLSAAQNVLVRASLQRATSLRPGQSVRVALGAAPSTAAKAAAASLTVPSSAVVWQGKQAHVFIETTQGFKVAPVTVIRQDAQRAEISGIAANVRVAVKGVSALKAQWQGGE